MCRMPKYWSSEAGRLQPPMAQAFRKGWAPGLVTLAVPDLSISQFAVKHHQKMYFLRRPLVVIAFMYSFCLFAVGPAMPDPPSQMFQCQSILLHGSILYKHLILYLF